MEGETMIDENTREAFLRELTALSLKYGLWIWGCGCCGSPCLVDKTDDTVMFDGDLFWDKRTESYKNPS